MRDVLLVLAVFAACVVEGVEALTIVLAVGITRGWRATMRGVVSRAGRAGCRRGRAGPGADGRSHRRASSRGRRVVADLRPGLVAQGDPARVGLQGAARRGRDLRAAACRRAHSRLPSPRGCSSTRTPSRSRSRRSCSKGSRWRSSCSTFGANQHNIPLAAIGAAVAVLAVTGVGYRGARAAVAGAREHVEVRGRDPADLVRNVLGRGGRRRQLAGLRRRAGRCDRVRRTRIPRTHRLVAASP